jgi:hypothetical protein
VECGKIREETFRFKHRLRNRNGWVSIAAGDVPLIINITFTRIIKHSRKSDGGEEKEKKLSLSLPPPTSSKGSSTVSLQNDNPEDTAVVFKSVTIKNHYLCEIQQFGR